MSQDYAKALRSSAQHADSKCFNEPPRQHISHLFQANGVPCKYLHLKAIQQDNMCSLPVAKHVVNLTSGEGSK
eukprot:9502215-Pyramimonas_sp.AAC.1